MARDEDFDPRPLSPALGAGGPLFRDLLGNGGESQHGTASLVPERFRGYDISEFEPRWTLPMHRMLTITFLALFALTACAADTDRAAVDALVKRSLENMVFIEGGSFMMGDQGGEFIDTDGNPGYGERWTQNRNDDHVHKVTLDGFYISRYEVTYSEFDVYTRSTGGEMLRERMIGHHSREPTDAVASTTWYQASGYCKWLGEITGLPFDLPSEAQWEYVARSRGTRNDLWPTNDGTYRHKENIDNGNGGLPLEPGRYPPNPLGIYDLAGNAMEWVRDWYNPWYYRKSPEHNPPGPDEKKVKIKVWRGGGGISPYRMNTVRRGTRKPDLGGGFQGIRCVINTDRPLPITPKPVIHEAAPAGALRVPKR